LPFLIGRYETPHGLTDHLGWGVAQKTAFGMIDTPQNSCRVDLVVGDRCAFE
jgi:hypothetical protein